MGRTLVWALPAAGVIGGSAVGLLIAALVGSAGALRPLGMVAYLVVIVVMIVGAGGGLAVGLWLAGFSTRSSH